MRWVKIFRGEIAIKTDVSNISNLKGLKNLTNI
jgi:hypothetical protein